MRGALAQWRYLVAQYSLDGVLPRLLRTWQRPGENAVAGGTHRPDIANRSHMFEVDELLAWHKGKRAGNIACSGHPTQARLLEAFGQSQIGNTSNPLARAATEKDILGLEITMDESFRMHIRQTFQGLQQNRPGLIQ